MDNKNRMWYLVVLIAIIVIPIIIVGLDSGEKKDYLQKDTITFEDVEYSIENVVKDDDFINVTIKIKNLSDKTISYSRTNFVMINQKGQQVDKNNDVLDDGTVLTVGELEPNEEVEGIITWIQNKNNKSLRIRYYDNIIKSGINDYKFGWSLD